MYGSRPKSSRFVLALTLGIALLSFTGCDTFKDDSSGEEEEDYEVTDDLGGRIDTPSDSGKATTIGHKKAQNVSFSLEARIQPPTVNGTSARTTSLNFDGNDNLYIGYLLVGNPFGGGIDILNAADPTNLTGATSLKSANTDVQGMTSPPDQDLVYVAEATRPEQADTSPSRVSVVELENGSASVTSRRLTGNVAKSVAVEPSDDQTGHDFHVITDNNSLYRFDNDLNEDTMLRQTVEDGVSFSGLATHQDQVFTLSVEGQIYYSDWGSANPLQSDAVNLDSGIELLGIGRLSAYDQSDGQFTQDERLFAALGSNGFAALDDDADDVKYRVTETGTPGPEGEPGYYTSVTLHGKVPSINGDLVYGARRYGIVDVYEVPSDGISNGLNLIRRLYLREAFDLGEEDDRPPSVNYVLGVEESNKLYVSGGKEGTLVLDLSAAENPKAISFAAFCTTQSDFAEDDVSITNVRENDEDEPIEISWESATTLSTVVLKAGPSMYNYDGESGTALSEAGDVPGTSQSPPRPCPAGEDLIVKNEDVDGDDDDDDDDDDNS